MLRRCSVLVVLFSAFVAANAAEPTPQALYEYRSATFGALGGHMRSLGMMVKGEVAATPADMAAHAVSLHATGEIVHSLFPAGTGPDAIPETEALAVIWTDAEGFAAKVQTFETETAKLAELAQAGDVAGFKGQFGKVGRSCGGCHDGFRKDDD